MGSTKSTLFVGLCQSIVEHTVVSLMLIIIFAVPSFSAHNKITLWLIDSFEHCQAHEYEKKI